MYSSWATWEAQHLIVLKEDAESRIRRAEPDGSLGTLSPAWDICGFINSSCTGPPKKSALLALHGAPIGSSSAFHCSIQLIYIYIYIDVRGGYNNQ